MTDLGLYLHVPFCRQRCSWCAFASEEGAVRSDLWLDRLVKDLENPPVPDARWVTAYIGGGTPTLLTPGQLDRLLAVVSRRLVPGAEVTLEANPESLQADHLTVLRQWGGTRLSLGIQTFDEAILARHHRPTRKNHLDRARLLVDQWPGDLSLDLICGLGGQTSDGQARDIEEALGWNPDHLSFYNLTVEPGTPLARTVLEGISGIPPEDDTALWWFKGRDRLESAGLLQYEVSNFSRPGAESAHNGRYWSLEPWWGLGPSAASLVPRDDGRFEYRTEPSSVGAWLTGEPPLVEVPSAVDLAKDRLLAGLRRRKGVPSAPWVDLLPRTLDRWKGRIEDSNGQLFLSREDFPFLDTFLREAFAELDERQELR